MAIKKIALNQDALETLKINSTSQKRDFIQPYREKNIPNDVVNIELAELAALTNVAKATSEAIVKDLGEEFADPEDHRYAASWGKFTNGFEMRAKIAKAPGAVRTVRDEITGDVKPYHTFDDREIITNIQASISNTDFNPQHVHELFESVFTAACDLAPDQRGQAEAKKRYLAAIKKIHDEFMTGTHYPKIKRGFFQRPTIKKSTYDDDSDSESDEEGAADDIILPDNLTEDGINKLVHDFELGLANKQLDLNSIIDRNTFMQRLYIGRLAVALWQAENGKTTGFPPEKAYQEYVKKIQARDIDNASTRRRPILINIYKQEVSKTDPNISHYIMVTQVPNSDVSSASRSLKDMMFSNDWTVTIENVTVERNKEGEVINTKVEPSTEYIRSSSIARITYKEAQKVIDGSADLSDFADAKELNHVYEAFRKLVLQYARDDLVKRINNGKDIREILDNKELLIQEAYITLLSPLNSKKAGQKWTGFMPSAVTTKTIYENEAAQLATTKYCLERIARDRKLKFSDADSSEIMRRTEKIRKRKKIALSVDMLKKIKITHRNYYCNYMVNKLGPVRTEKLDIFGTNRKYFLAGNRSRRNHIAEYIDHSKELERNLSAKDCQLLRTRLIDIFQGDAERIKSKLETIGEPFRSQIKQCPELLEILKTYNEIEAYFYKRFYNPSIKKTADSFLGTPDKEEQTRIADSYLTAAKDAKLAKLLGFKAHVTCKSGVDRTGMFASFMEAMACVQGLLVTNLLLSLQHGANRIVKSINIPGIYGLQIASSALSGMRSIGGDAKIIKQFLSDGLLDKIGKMGKAIYAHSETVYNLVSQSLAAQAIMERTLSIELSSQNLMIYSPHSKTATPSKKLDPTSLKVEPLPAKTSTKRKDPWQ